MGTSNRRRTRQVWKSAVVLMLWIAFLALPVGRAVEPKSTRPWQSKPAGRPRRLVQKVVSILQSEGARDAQWGIQVISLRRGQPILSWNQEKLFIPASTAKLFTTAAALVRLGPEFRYKTTAEITGPVDGQGRVRGDLIIVGRGDPNLSARVLPYHGRTERSGRSTKALEEMADAIAARGIRTIDGDLVVDDSYFVHQPYSQDWTLGDMVWGYGAPVSALSVNDNVITLTVLPGQGAGALASVRQQPLENYFDLTNHIVTVADQEGSSGRRLSFDRQPGSRVLFLWGQIPEHDSGLTESVAMDDPSRFTGEFFRQEFARRGIEIAGTFKVRHQESFDVPDLGGASQSPISSPAIVIAAHESAPLIESLKVINKVSQNLHAEMLLKTLGRERRNVGSTEAGLEEVNNFLREIGVPESQVALRDGSGLSRQTLVSPSAVVALLQNMYNSKYRSSWLDSLPVAGVDGSLAQRFRNPAVTARIHAKTGSFAGVASLAGYMIGRNQEALSFAIFMNNGNMTHSAATDLMDRILEEIAKEMPRGR